MGIRKSIKLLLACSLFSFSVTAYSQDCDKVCQQIKDCKAQGGTMLPREKVSETDLGIVGGEQVKKICYKVLCYDASAGVGTVDFTNIAEYFAKKAESRGFGRIAYDDNLCVKEYTTVRVEDPLDTNNDDNTDDDNNNRGGGSVTVGLDVGPWSIGDVINVNGRIITVGNNSAYKRYCIRNGRIRRRCARAELVDTDTDTVVSEVDTGGTVVIRGGGGGGGGGDYYVTYRGRSYRCTYGVSAQSCLRDRYGEIVTNVGDIRNCDHCGSRYYSSRRDGNSWGSILGGAAQLAGAVLPPVMGYLGVKAQANAMLGINQAWAGAAATGFENCRMMQTHYVDATYGYLTQNTLPDRDVVPPQCNGYNLGAFAGMNGMYGNGFGGFGNPWGSAGYSNQFMAGMYGPGFGFNPYMNVTGGFGNPYAGLGMNGFPGAGVGLNVGLGLGGAGFGTGWPGINGGVGINGGWGGPGGWVGTPGINGGAWGQPGWNTGWGAPGWGNGGINAGIGWGANGGWGNGGWNGGGWNGGAWGGGHWGGAPGNWGGGYWGNTSMNGGDFWSVQNAHQNNQMAFQAGSMYQQAALQNQVNQAGFNAAGFAGGAGGWGGGWGGGYNAGWSPFNVGGGITAGFRF